MAYKVKHNYLLKHEEDGILNMSYLVKINGRRYGGNIRLTTRDPRLVFSALRMLVKHKHTILSNEIIEG